MSENKNILKSGKWGDTLKCPCGGYYLKQAYQRHTRSKVHNLFLEDGLTREERNEKKDNRELFNSYQKKFRQKHREKYNLYQTEYRHRKVKTLITEVVSQIETK